MRAAIREDVADIAGFAVAGIDNCRAVALPRDGARVAGLAAAQRVKHGTVDDERVVINPNDRGLARLQVGIFAE